MLELVISLGVAGFALLAAAAYMMHKMDRELHGLRVGRRLCDEYIEQLEEESSELFRKWSDDKSQYEERAIKTAARYHAGSCKSEEQVAAANARWTEAARQNANLAEQLATIRTKYPEAHSESEEHIEDVSPSIPYSVELADWLSKFESPQAREIAMEQADMFRASGLDDEQIIDRLEEEWTA